MLQRKILISISRSSRGKPQAELIAIRRVNLPKRLQELEAEKVVQIRNHLMPIVGV
jgi:hypothetical protein